MKEILISIQPQWVEKILRGEKVLELRKSIPRCDLPCKVYIYMTKKRNFFMANRKDEEVWFGDGLRYDKTEIVKFPKCDIQYWHLLGKVVAEFTLNEVQEYECELWDENTFESIGEVWYSNDGYNEKEKDIVATDGETCELLEKSCLTWNDLRKYLGQGFSTCYAWKIENLKVYKEPKELNYLQKPNTLSFEDYLYSLYDGNGKFGDVGYSYASYLFTQSIKKAPQSWCYVGHYEQ